jgi:D-3-phosphoglycerate dehydrogenase
MGSTSDTPPPSISPAVLTPTANARSVAEHPIALTLALAQMVIEADAAVRGCDWTLRYQARMAELHGSTMGLIGFGTIGRMTGAIARHGFSMHLMHFSPNTLDAALAEAGAERAGTLSALLREADGVSLHRTLRPDTRHSIDAAALACTKPTAFLVNTARGELVNSRGTALGYAEVVLDVLPGRRLPHLVEPEVRERRRRSRPCLVARVP